MHLNHVFKQGRPYPLCCTTNLKCSEVRWLMSFMLDVVQNVSVLLHGCERLHFFITTSFIARMVECPTCSSATSMATYGNSFPSDHQTRAPLSVKTSMSHRSCDGHSLRSDIRSCSWDASYHLYPITDWTGAAVKFSFALQVCMITVRMCQASFGRQVVSPFSMRPSLTGSISSTGSCLSCRTRHWVQ